MKVLSPLLFVLLGTGLTGAAQAQGKTDDQADVWAVVEAQWSEDEKGDKKWLDRLLTEDFAGWTKSSPAPRNKMSTKMWDRYAETQSKLAAYELYPLAIIVHGDTAVAHYLYSCAYKHKDGEVEMNNGRFSDILVRSDDGWKLLAWHGGDDAKDD